QVLLDLQKSWGRTFSGWEAGGNCSLAEFVKCDARGMVTDLLLFNEGLTGSIPESISALDRLSY
ncbi:unnamed protein product, partial [Closterium sp. Yama58-4]